MTKVQIGPQNILYPLPALIIGSNVDANPSFSTVAWAGIASSDPPMVSVSLRHQRHTLKGIKQHMAFSVNVPSVDIVRETDYCGIISSSKTDKVKVCGFQLFHGKSTGVPLIEQCPVNLECSVVHMLDLGSHTMVIGKIVETYVSDGCLSEGKPDVEKIKAFCYVSDPAREYRAIGKAVGKAFSIGLELKNRE